MKQKLKPIFKFLLLVIYSSNFLYSQEFGNFGNIEELFNLPKKGVESFLKEEGYSLISKEMETGIYTYTKNLLNNKYTYAVNVTFKNNKLDKFLWNDYLQRGYFIIQDIENRGYEIIENKTDNYSGIFYLESKSENLDVIIYKTIYNTRNGRISFMLFRNNKRKDISLEKKKLKEKIEKEKQEEERKKLEITSKIYDLRQYDEEKYNSLVALIKQGIVNYFNTSENPNSVIPSFEKLYQSQDKRYRFKNMYKVYLKLEDKSRPTEIRGNVVLAGSRDIKQSREITNISGTDKDCILFTTVPTGLSTLEIEGYEVMTEATVDSIEVDYIKGITTVKIKNNKIEFLENFPDEDIINEIREQLKDRFKKGKYTITYEYKYIMGDKGISIDILKKQPKKRSSILGGIIGAFIEN